MLKIVLVVAYLNQHRISTLALSVDIEMIQTALQQVIHRLQAEANITEAEESREWMCYAHVTPGDIFFHEAYYDVLLLFMAQQIAEQNASEERLAEAMLRPTQPAARGPPKRDVIKKAGIHPARNLHQYTPSKPTSLHRHDSRSIIGFNLRTIKPVPAFFQTSNFSLQTSAGKLRKLCKARNSGRTSRSITLFRRLLRCWLYRSVKLVVLVISHRLFFLVLIELHRHNLLQFLGPKDLQVILESKK